MNMTAKTAWPPRGLNIDTIRKQEYEEHGEHTAECGYARWCPTLRDRGYYALSFGIGGSWTRERERTIRAAAIGAK